MGISNVTFQSTCWSHTFVATSQKTAPKQVTERAGRGGSYALRCDVQVYVHVLWCALLLVSLVFGEAFFGGSASLHD